MRFLRLGLRALKLVSRMIDPPEDLRARREAERPERMSARCSSGFHRMSKTQYIPGIGSAKICYRCGQTFSSMGFKIRG